MNDLELWYVPRRSGFRGPRGLAVPALLCFVLICAATAAPAVAAERLEWLEISLWPEFDRPAMLVMLRARVPADAEFPATVTLPMPALAGTPSAVAYRATDGSMLIAPSTLTTEGDTIRVTLTVPTPEIRLEYYVTLDTGKPERAYRFHWPGGIAVGQVTYDVLHPWGAVDVEVRPAGARKQLPDGRIEERGNLGAWTVADEVTIDVRYSKLSGKPTTGGPQSQPAAAAAQVEPPTGRFTSPDAAGSDSRWLVLLIVSSVTFLCGFALGRLRRRSR